MPETRVLAQKRVRFNREEFGFIVGFPDGEIVLTNPLAMTVLRADVTREEVEPFLLEELRVQEPFHLSTPPLMWLELTRKCDLACPHCYIHGGPAREAEMPTSRWLQLLAEMAEMGVWAVAFTGGEPTLHPDFALLVRRARELGLLVGVATHGLLLTDELLASLPTDGVILSVSIDELHHPRAATRWSQAQRGLHAIEPARESWAFDPHTQRALDAIERAHRHGFLTNIMTNTHRGNADQLAPLVRWAREHEVSVRSVPFSPIGRGKQHTELENTPEQVEAAGGFWLQECEWEHEYHRQAGLCVGVIFNYGLSLAYMTRRCSSGRYLGYLAADGTVFPCTMCAAENLFASGNVRSRAFPDVWRDDWRIRHYSWAAFEDACRGCPINDERYYCASRCPAMSYARHGTFNQCGASEFEIQSTLRRTELLEATPTGAQSNVPVVRARIPVLEKTL